MHVPCSSHVAVPMHEGYCAQVGLPEQVDSDPAQVGSAVQVTERQVWIAAQVAFIQV